MKPTALALAGIIASAAALALLAGFATTQSTLGSFYATGTAQAVSEPIGVSADLSGINVAAGAQGVQDIGYFNVTAQDQVNVTKIKITIENARQLRPYFKYLQLVLKSEYSGETGETKAVLSLEKPSAVIVLDNEDFKGGVAKISVTAYYEAKEGMLFDSLPIELNIQVLSVS